MDLGLSMSSNASHEPSEGNYLLLVDHILEVRGSTVKRHLLDGLSCLTGVLFKTLEISIDASHTRFAVTYTA